MGRGVGSSGNWDALLLRARAGSDVSALYPLCLNATLPRVFFGWSLKQYVLVAFEVFYQQEVLRLAA